jgi:putative serine protease PepD
MDRGPAGVDGAGPPTPGVRGSRRLLAAGVVAGVVLLVVIAVLATRLAGPPSAAKAAAPSPSPTATASLSVTAIYQRLAPSVVLVRTGHDLGAGVIVADNGTI